jgi:hypothetical protein
MKSTILNKRHPRRSLDRVSASRINLDFVSTEEGKTVQTFQATPEFWSLFGQPPKPTHEDVTRRYLQLLSSLNDLFESRLIDLTEKDKDSIRREIALRFLEARLGLFFDDYWPASSCPDLTQDERRWHSLLNLAGRRL